MSVAGMNSEKYKPVYTMMAERPDDNKLRGILLLDEPMNKHTSWRAGGTADRYYIPADLDDLLMFLQRQEEDEEILWLGLGSNLLIRDGGLRGTVVSVTGVLDELLLKDHDTVKAGTGVTCAKLARFAANSGLTGIEFLAGIPGTVGGALTMNAGAFGGETWDFVSTVETVSRSGEIKTSSGKQFDPGYRTVNIPDGEWFISAEFKLFPDPENKALEIIRELLARRAQTQPMGESSCGSVFRNPDGDYAARLIDSCGLKGSRSGKARVSEKHANFIINDDGASATDIEGLINHIQKVVNDKTGIRLETEVRIIGER